MFKPAIDNRDDRIDSRDVIKRIRELKEEVGEEAVTAYFEILQSDWDQTPKVVQDALTDKFIQLENLEDEAEELQALLRLAKQGETLDEWEDGMELIHDEFFEDFVRNQAYEEGKVKPMAEWPLNHIDWAQAANEVRSDYTAVDYEGETFWAKA